LFLTRGEGDPFPFQELEKTLGHGVFMKFASANHARNQIVRFQQSTIIGAAVLGEFNQFSQHDRGKRLRAKHDRLGKLMG
jgi:hypothetical protein